MIILLTSVALFIPWLCGYIFIRTMTGRRNVFSWLEVAALSFLVGSGILTLCMLLISMAGLKLSTFNILIALFIILIYPSFLFFKNGIKVGLPPKISIKLNWYEWILVLAISLRVAYSFFEALIKPVIECDSFANWSLRAKVFFFESCVPTTAPANYLAGGGHIYYPLNISLLQTWMFNIIGSWNDQVSKVIFPVLFLCLVIIFYCSVKRFSGIFIALLATYMLTSLPLMLHHSTIEYADLPLAIYFSCAAFLLIEYTVSGDKAHLLVSAILSGIAAWTKNEGFQLILILLAILAFNELFIKKSDKRSARDILLFFLIAAAFKAPWSIFNVVYKVPREIWQNIEYQKAIENIGRLPVIINNFYQRMFFYGNWNIAWALALILTIFAGKSLTKPRLLYSLTIVLLSTFAFAALYYITPSYDWLLNGTTVNRNFLVVMPLLIYYMAACASELFINERGTNI